MDIKNVRKWCREFESGRTAIHDEERTGRPSLSDETVAKIERVMRQDRRITLDDLSILVPEVSRTSIYRVLTEKLNYRKVCARWVPRMLTEDHKRQRVDSSREFLRRYADEKDNFG
jgi:histone-lysine N-methyltransferase SETMAR